MIKLKNHKYINKATYFLNPNTKFKPFKTKAYGMSLFSINPSEELFLTILQKS